MSIADVISFIDSWRENNNLCNAELNVEQIIRFAREMQEQISRLSFAAPPDARIISFEGKIGDIPAYKIARAITKNSGGQYASVLDSEAGKALYAIYPSLREAVGPEMADQLLNGGRN